MTDGAGGPGTWTDDPERPTSAVSSAPPETVVIAVDPGPGQSGFAVLDASIGRVLSTGVRENAELIRYMRAGARAWAWDHVTFERFDSYGMPVGRETFDAILWTGRMIEAVDPLPWSLIPRRDVKLYLCGTARAKDANVRQAIVDRYGSSRAVAIGTKHSRGPLYGVTGDAWSALAVALTWADRYGA